MREVLEKRAARKGEKHPALTVERPDELAYLWDWFAELDRARGEGFSGPAPLTYQDIDAWSRLSGRRPEPMEVDALLALDNVVRSPGEMEDEPRDDLAWPTRKEA